MGRWVDVAAEGEIPPGRCRVVDLAEERVAVYHIDGRYYAIQDLCTHDYAPLDGGRVEGDEVICPRHGARFCLRTGAVLAPPAYEDLRTFEVRVHEGRIQVYDEDAA
ncbi:non-heme iron oxygenase ferredoxin subunit [Inmirania thermothiophila]|uniref:3-phenylpropionate/trans-cinnamate dioxygenase ferredoxin subunit n=1 Tax=Inmirania thermothiophila TaxID=1750597 RepID=A0A3N1Y1A0_9GAMM|nr:non-heme iron oxygenase ferredoxin subunit [Inmirania thermothiophila]ROR32599.1 3-phenylpropionate/trans-cinnamate dioxygenase ferredoxin subunit [Inmirania thermothiophila]